MISGKDLPEAIQWHEGMLLTPHHFQQFSLRCEQLIHYHISMTSPFYWGIRSLKIDETLLVDGTFRILEFEAVMPDGLVVCKSPHDDKDLSFDLTPYTDDMKQKPLTIHIAVPAKRRGVASTKGELARYESVEGEPVVDENTGDSELTIPRLRPRLMLLATDVPHQKYSSFPVAKVMYSNETYVLTDYIPPTLIVSLRSPIGEICFSIAHRLREKAVFLSERINSPSLSMKGAMLIETKSMIQGLTSNLPPFEAILNTGRAHPFMLYTSLCAIVGGIASLGRGLIPPALKPYNHNDLRATFEQAREFIFRMIDEGILEAYTPISFNFEDGKFSLKLRERWMTEYLIIGVRGRPGLTEESIIRWIKESIIGSVSIIESMIDKRILGAPREKIEGDEELIPARGTLLFSIKVDPEFIKPNEVLQILNMSDPEGKNSPSEIVLYIRSGLK